MGYLTGPIAPRKHNWGEQLFDEIQNLSVKQTLGLPLSAPLTFGTGALSGLSFGLFDLTDELHGGLGELALPDKLTTSLEVAGQIGGSFVPYIGASSVASKLFTGLSTGAKMARGAFTFAAPEAIRQVVEKKMDPLGGARSLTSGALFALPRKYAAPLVLGSELALGAEPEEAAITAGFAALFAGGGKKPSAKDAVGSRLLEPGTERLRLQARTGMTKPIPTTQKLLPPNVPERAYDPRRTSWGNPVEPTPGMPNTTITNGSIGFTQQGIAPKPRTAPTPSTPAGKPTNISTALALGAQPVSDRIKQAAAQGQYELPLSKPKSQVELLREVEANPMVSDAQKTQMQIFTGHVDNVARTTPPEQVQYGLTKAIKDEGVMSPHSSLLRYVHAEQSGLVAPKGSNNVNLLMVNNPKTFGVALMEQGPNNPYYKEAAAQDVFDYMNAQGPDGKIKAAQFQQLLDDIAEAKTSAEAAGGELSEAQKIMFRKEVKRLESGLKPEFRDPDEAAKIARRQLEEETLSVEDVDAFVQNLPTAYQELPDPVRSGILRNAAERRNLLQREGPIVTLKDAYKMLYGDRTPEEIEVHRRLSDLGAEIEFPQLMPGPVPKQLEAGITPLQAEVYRTGAELKSRTRLTTRKGKPRSVTDKYNVTFAGQHVKEFNSIKKLRKWMDDLETGMVEPENVHELRMLGYPRGIIVDFTGKDLHLLNQLSREQVAGVQSIEDAARIVRNAPQVTQAAREIGPRVDAIPPMPGSGGHGGVATEQSLPFCPIELVR